MGRARDGGGAGRGGGVNACVRDDTTLTGFLVAERASLRSWAWRRLNDSERPPLPPLRPVVVTPTSASAPPPPSTSAWRGSDEPVTSVACTLA